MEYADKNFWTRHIIELYEWTHFENDDRDERIQENLVELQKTISKRDEIVNYTRTDWQKLDKKRKQILRSLFVQRHPDEIKYEFLDLKGYQVKEAVEICYEMLCDVEKALNDGRCVPN